MDTLTLTKNSALTESANYLSKHIELEDPDCKSKYDEWLATQNGEIDLPEQWEDSLHTTTDEGLAYFSVETALSLIFKTVVATQTTEDDISTFKELSRWQEEVSSVYYTGLSEGVYNWVFQTNEPLEESSLDSIIDYASSLEIEDQHDPLGNIYHTIFPNDLRKELGEFYTSERIINYLLDNTGYDAGIWSKKIVDPANGSGSFLIAAVERLLESRPEHLKDSEAVYNIFDTPLIVGFDINPFACEMARLRLFITVYPFLEEDDEYTIQKIPIFNIDSLSRNRTHHSEESNQTLAQFTDGGELRNKSVDDIQLQEIVRSSTADHNSLLDELLSEYDSTQIRPTPHTSHGHQDRLIGRILRDNVQYDAVVGNPPYVRIQKIPKEKREEYKNGFQSASGRFDLSVLFLEYAIDALKEGGSLGFITSNKFLTTQYGKGIRNYLYKESGINVLIDFTDTDVFDVTVLPCILAATKGKDNSPFGYGLVKQSTSSKDSIDCDDLLNLIDSHSQAGESVEGIYKIQMNGHSETVKLRCFETSLPDDEEATWTFIPEKEQRLIDKIESEKTSSLGEISEKISVGVKTTANNVFVDPITDSTISEKNIERELVHPAISGKNVSRWTINWSPEDSNKPSYLMYPHKAENGSVVPVDLSEYPNVRDYLQTHYDQLAGRSYLEDAGRNWFECWVPQHPDYFEVEHKIITPEMAPGNSFALDTSGFYCIGSCYSILLQYDNPTLYHLLTGILNSQLAEFYLKANSSTQLYADRFRYNKSYIENLPVIYTDPENISSTSIDSKSPQDIRSPKEMMGYIAQLVYDIRNDDIEAQRAEKQIDKLTYRLFNISPEEQQTIANYLQFTSSE
jgi:hypothetical protein